MVSWADIQRGIFAGESGGDYGALYNYQNRPNGLFSNVNLTNMTIGDVIQFTSPQGQYAQYVKGQVGRTATPVGAYQVVGSTLRDAVNALGLDPSQKFDKATQDKIGQWIFKTQGTGAWQGYKGPQSQPKETDMSMNPNAPQRTGLLGFMDLMREPDPSTGMTAMERFGAALDPLLSPEQRMGQTFAASGAQRLQTQSRNRTIETLKQRAAAGDLIARDVLSGLESGAYDAKTAMSLYLGKQFETPKDTRTSQIQNYEYWLAQGKTPQEAEALVKSGGINIGGQEKAYEKTMGEEYAKRNIALSQEAQNAVKTLQTINIQENLIQDPSFRSGQGQALFDAASGFLSRFGIGEADLASNTAFQAFARQSVLDQLGGSLGTGVSNADVSFINGTVANLENTGESIALLLGIKKKVAERQLKVAEIARQWKSDNNTQYLDDRWDAYLAQWSQENPIFPDADSYL